MKTKFFVILAIVALALIAGTASATTPANYSLSASTYDVYDNAGSLSVSVTASMTANPGYEDGLTGWALFGSGASASSSVVHSGIGSAYVVSTTGNFIGASQRVLATGGETLMLDAYCYPTAYVGANSVYVQIYQYNATGGIIGTYTIAAPSTLNQWHELTGTFTTNANTVNVLVSIITYDGSIAYFDDVKLIPVSYTGSVDYATADGTATAGYDYTATSGTLSFAAGETSNTFTVPIINRDAYYGSRSFNVALSSPVNGNVTSPSSATVMIADTHSSISPISTGYRYLYVSNWDSSSITVIDPNLPAKVGTILTRAKPLDVVVNPAGTLLYVTYSQATPSGTYVDVFNTIDYSNVASILVSSNPTSQYCSITINDVGTRVYVGLYIDNKVVAIDTINNIVIDDVTIPYPDYGLGYFNGYLYVTSYQDFDTNSGTVWKIDSNTLDIINHIPNDTVNYPRDAVIDRANGVLAILNNNDTITSVPLSTFIPTGVATTAPITGPFGISYNSSGYVFAGFPANPSIIAYFKFNQTTQKYSFVANTETGFTDINDVYYDIYNNTLWATKRTTGDVYIYDANNKTTLGYIHSGNGALRISVGTQATRAVQLTQFKLTTLGYLGLDNVPTAVYLNGYLMFTGVTDGNGVFACYLNPTSTYQVAFNSPANGVNATYTITPTNSYYGFDQPFLDVIGGQFSNLLGPIVTPDSFGNQSQVSYQQSADFDQVSNTGYINGSYVDYSGATTALSFKLYGNNSTFGGTPTLIETQTAGAGGNYNFTVLDAGGNSYYVEITATQSDASTKKYYPQGVGFPGQIVLAETGIRLDWLFYIGMAIPLFIWGAGVVTRRGYMGFIGTVAAGIIGGYCCWYRVFIPDLLFWSAFAACMILSIGVIIVDAEKWGR